MRMKNVASTITKRRQKQLRAISLGKNRAGGLPKGSFEGYHVAPSTYITPRNSGYYNTANWKGKAINAARRQSMANSIDNSGRFGTLNTGRFSRGLTDGRSVPSYGAPARMAKILKTEQIR